METIGDCWVGSCGLPETRTDHAVRISRFAIDIVRKTGVLVKQLEVELGPDTAFLGVRVGITSGPVVAGTFLALLNLKFGGSNNSCPVLLRCAPW